MPVLRAFPIPLLALLALSACGGPDPAPLDDPAPLARAKPPSEELVLPPPPAPKPEPTSAERTRARLEAFFAVVRKGGGAAAAPYLVYRLDEDRERRWKDTCNYDREAERKHVDAVVARVKKLLDLGEPRFESFRSERESEGTWLVWDLTLGGAEPGEKAKKAAFACLDLGDRIALGDID